MAVTYIQQPQAFTPSDSPVVWTFSSNQTAQANFSFIVTLIVNGQNVSVHQIFPEVGNVAHFDASEIVRSLVSVMPIPYLFESVGFPNSFKNIKLSIKEKYGSPATLQPTAYLSNEVKAFKSSLCGNDFVNWNYLNYAYEGVNKNFLTENVERIILPTESVLLSYLDNLSDTAYVVFLTYGESGNFLDEYSLEVENEALNTINVSLEQISFIDAGANVDLIHYIDVQVNELVTGGDVVIKKQRVKIWRECSNGTTLYWNNKFGVVDSFSLTHNISEMVEANQFSYEKQFGNWVGSTFVFDTNDSGVQGLQRNMMDKYELSSDWLTESQQHFLQSSIEAPFVVLKVGNDYIKGTLKNTGYEKGQTEYDELLQVNLTFVPSTTRKSIVV